MSSCSKQVTLGLIGRVQAVAMWALAARLKQGQAHRPQGPALRALTVLLGELGFTPGTQLEKEASTDGGGTQYQVRPGCLGVGKMEASALRAAGDWYWLVSVAPQHPPVKEVVGTRAVLQWQPMPPGKTLWQGVWAPEWSWESLCNPEEERRWEFGAALSNFSC